jgi:tetratricopeptide (TPR) repeat protein
VTIRVALLLSLVLTGGGALAAQVDPALRGVTLTRSVNQVLGHLQGGWIGWMSSFYQNQPDVAEEQLEDLLDSLRVLGFERLPELSIAATVRGVEAALQGSAERAEMAFSAAERLDPGRPETALGRALLARESGQRLAALRHQTEATIRLLKLRAFSTLWWRNIAFSLLGTLLLAGGLFVTALLARRGRDLFRTLHGAMEPRLGSTGSAVVVAVLFVWPLFLPHGLAWVLLYWSILLWVVTSTSQRIVLTAVWLVAGAMPLILTWQVPRVEVTLSPPVRAMNALGEGRLYGTFFSDIGVLASRLPEEPAVLELLGDVHRTLGQWEEALPFYRAVLENDPDDQTALISVGAYYFRKGDYGNAVRFFQRAANLEPPSAAAYFNLSQAYSESYLFDEQKQALGRARSLDDQQVSGWIQGVSQERVVTYQGGLAESEKIRRELARLQAERTGARPSLVPYLALALPLFGLAFGHALGRGLGAPEVEVESFPDRGWAHRMTWALLPGLASADEGHGGRGFLAALVLAGLVLLLAPRSLGFSLPWGLDPERGVAVATVLASLVVFFALRVVRGVRS